MRASMKLLQYICLWVILLGWFLPPVGNSYDKTHKNQGKVFTSPKVDTSSPTWFKPSDNKDIAYWLKVLPYEEYRYHDQYIVVPAMGMVAPIMEAKKESDDYKNAIKGNLLGKLMPNKKKCTDPKKCFDYDKYLKWGPTVYPGTATIWSIGNTFIFWHSNYFHNDSGKFKTIFRDTYNLEKGDKIRVYKKFKDKWYFFEYTVTLSKLINADDIKYIGKLKGEEDKVTITLSACRPIGTAKQRRINRAELTNLNELSLILNPPKPVVKPTVTPKMKRSKSVVVWTGTSTSWTVVK